MITITAPDGQLLADQRGQYLYTRQGECLGACAPTGPARWDSTVMARLWGDMCAVTGEAYVLRLSPQVSPG